MNNKFLQMNEINYENVSDKNRVLIRVLKHSLSTNPCSVVMKTLSNKSRFVYNESDL